MKVDLFKNIYQTTPVGRAKIAHHYLDEIRDGKYNDIISRVRVETDKSKRNEIKKELPNVIWTGTFEKRSIDGIKKASGLTCIDIDNCKNKDDLRKRLESCIYSFSVFLSPSANFKVLVKIPPTTDPEGYKARYSALSKYYKNEIIKDDGEVDNTSDLCRMCYLSSDPNLYLNDNSDIFTDINVEEIYFNPEIGISTNIPLTDEEEIANKLLIWWRNKHFDSHNRNSSLFKLAVTFNDFGVKKDIALRYCYEYEQKGFRKKEIKNVIDSAYSRTANFGTKKFEDPGKKENIIKLVLKGKSNKEIIKSFPDIEEEKLIKEIEIQRNNNDVDCFWKFNEKGKLNISPHRLKFYLESRQIYKYYPTGKDTYTFIEQDENFMDEIYESNIKDFVLSRLLSNNHLNVFDMMAKSSRYFSSDFLSMLDTVEFNTIRDGKDYAWLYYQNYALKITPDGIEKIKYNDLDGFVWKNQIIDRDYIDADHHESEYRSFIWYCAGENVSNYNSLKSVIGYLLHSFKNGANNKAIIFIDEVISDNPNGGSGKSLFCNAIGKIKKTTFLDGKSFDFNKSFPYQTVPIDSQLIIFDDVKENFKFENLFSLITQGITLEYKGQQSVKLDVEDSPKIVITTNYTIRGSGGSFERRKFEIEMSSYFNSDFSPLDKFGRMLFDDWDHDEWARFDKYMINCLQYYLENGLIESKHKSLELRKIYNETNKQFFDWIENCDYSINERIIKNDFFNRFKGGNSPDFDWMKTTHLFTKWLKSYSDYKGFEYEENASNGQRWFMFEKTDEEIDELNFNNIGVGSEPPF